MRVHVLALDDVFDTGLSAVLDTLGTAAELAQASGKPGPRIEVTVVGLRRRIRTHQGLIVTAKSPSAAGPADVVVVPGLFAKLPDALSARLARPDVPDAAGYLREVAGASLVAGACTGTFVVAESGLLAGCEATTSWWLAPEFRRRYPDVRLQASEMIVKAGRVVTAGAALAHVDLGLWIVRRQSPTLAARTARYLIADVRPSQAAYVIPDQLAHEDEVVLRFERFVRKHLAAPFAVREAAKAARVSERTLARRLEGVLGQTPIEYVQALRVERALYLLQTTDESVDAIAERVGYAQGTTLRTLLRRRLGRGVRQIRAAAR